eukprot:4780962-Ditylum_brightwellii.AAC.1
MNWCESYRISAVARDIIVRVTRGDHTCCVVSNISTTFEERDSSTRNHRMYNAYRANVGIQASDI